LRQRLLITVLILAALAVAVFFIWPERFRSALPGGAGGSQQASQQKQAPPPPEVAVIEVTAEEVPLPVEYAGRVAGFREVEIRALVGGRLLKREFEEGAKVTEGQALFRIDPATYKLDLARAEAQKAQAQAQLVQAEQNFERIEQLANREVSTARQLEEARAQRDLNRAAVQLAQAAIDAAQLNISYTTIAAPVTGSTALESPPEGTLVLAQQTVLTTITQLDPAFVNFSVTDTQFQSYRALNRRRKVPIRQEDLTVELHYADGSVYSQPGRIDIAAQRIDAQTGTVQARAIFPNPDASILPGQFVRVVVRGFSLENAIVVPERAINQGPQGASVFVVGAENTAEARPVQLGQRTAAGFVVSDGLKPGEKVIVEGIIRVRPGAKVRPVPANTAPPAPQQTGEAKPGAAQQAKDGAGAGK
jgi:membrane fusion protein, multidrug efflux system